MVKLPFSEKNFELGCAYWIFQNNLYKAQVKDV